MEKMPSCQIDVLNLFLMSNFLIILGLILFFFSFLGFAALAVYLPKAEKEDEKWAVLPFVVMGSMLAAGLISYHFGMKIKKEKPMALSTACAVVLGYQHYENCAGRGGIRCQPYEKILLKLDGSEYSRAMRFDTHIARKNINDRVCFSFYDRNQYSHLKSSNITQWIAP